MVNIIQYILDAIAYGSLFALMALGLALLFSVMGLMNFAYGELIMASGFTMYYTQSWGVVPMIITTLVVTVVLSMLMELIAFRPVRRGTAVTLLVTSFAVAFAMESLGWMTVGRGPEKAVSPYAYLTTQFYVAGVRISKLEIITWIAAAVVLAGMTLLLKRTRLGIQLRASTEDFRMAQLVGVRANRVISSAFALTGLIGGVVGILYIFRTGAVAPDMGEGPLFVAFVGAVIGGLGSLPGAALGGFALGAIIDGLEAALPRSVASYTELFAFVAVIIILLVLPDGLISIRGGMFRRLFVWRRKSTSAEVEVA
jgi:branched-chain amino acid transport system permease protein